MIIKLPKQQNLTFFDHNNTVCSNIPTKSQNFPTNTATIASTQTIKLTTTTEISYIFIKISKKACQSYSFLFFHQTIIPSLKLFSKHTPPRNTHYQTIPNTVFYHQLALPGHSFTSHKPFSRHINATFRNHILIFYIFSLFHMKHS